MEKDFFDFSEMCSKPEILNLEPEPKPTKPEPARLKPNRTEPNRPNHDNAEEVQRAYWPRVEKVNAHIWLGKQNAHGIQQHSFTNKITAAAQNPTEHESPVGMCEEHGPFVTQGFQQFGY